MGVEAPIRVGFVLHVMQVAGAEVLVAETIRRLGSRIDPVVFCLDRVGALGDQLQGDGVPVIAFNRRPGLDWSVPGRLAREIRARQIEVLHAHQYTPFFYGAIASRLAGKRPSVIFTEHGRHYPDTVSSRRRLLNRLVFDRLADHVNAVCAFSADSLGAVDGFNRSRIDIIENGVDLTRYGRTETRDALRARLGLEPDRRYIVTVARFHPVKDHATLLRAFAIVARRHLDTDLLLVGDGDLRPELERFVEQNRLSSRVQFLGVRRDVADLLKASDIFALTSVSEAASITLLEAMACELPVVVTAVGGNPEIVRDGIDGILAPRSDHEAIARSVIQLLDDARLRASLAHSAGRRVRARYRLEQTIDRYWNLYRRPTTRQSAA